MQRSAAFYLASSVGSHKRQWGSVSLSCDRCQLNLCPSNFAGTGEQRRSSLVSLGDDERPLGRSRENIRDHEQGLDDMLRVSELREDGQSDLSGVAQMNEHGQVPSQSPFDVMVNGFAKGTISTDVYIRRVRFFERLRPVFVRAHLQRHGTHLWGIKSAPVLSSSHHAQQPHCEQVQHATRRVWRQELPLGLFRQCQRSQYSCKRAFAPKQTTGKQHSTDERGTKADL